MTTRAATFAQLYGAGSQTLQSFGSTNYVRHLLREEYDDIISRIQEARQQTQEREQNMTVPINDILNLIDDDAIAEYLDDENTDQWLADQFGLYTEEELEDEKDSVAEETREEVVAEFNSRIAELENQVFALEAEVSELSGGLV